MFNGIRNWFRTLRTRKVSYVESKDSGFRYRPLGLKLKEGNFDKAMSMLLPGEKLYRADPDNLVMGKPFLVLVDGKKHFYSCLHGSWTFIGWDLYAGIPDPTGKQYEEVKDSLRKREQRLGSLC